MDLGFVDGSGIRRLCIGECSPSGHVSPGTPVLNFSCFKEVYAKLDSRFVLSLGYCLYNRKNNRGPWFA